jgi:hypothetical protein
MSAMPRLAVIALLSFVVSGCAFEEADAVATAVTTEAVVGATTTTSSVAPATGIESVCEAFSSPIALGVVEHPDLTEISGIAAGSEGFWVHNDSGSEARLWQVDAVGAVTGSIVIPVRNVDWEDMASGPGSGNRPYLYVADIGDNLNRRASVTIYRLAEPSDLVGDPGPIETLTVRYPAGSADAEAFMVDPVTGDAFIVTKSSGAVMRVPHEAWSDSAVDAQQVATIDLGPLGFVTSGDISPDGAVIALRTYLDVWLWVRRDGETVADAMRGQPCRAPSAREPQGEAITFDGEAYVTVSEGSSPTINRMGR